MSTLNDIFNSAKTTSRNPSTLAKRAGTTTRAATTFLRDQPSAQITKRAIKPPEDSYSPTGDKRGVYLADVIFLKDYAGVNGNQKRTCILTVMGVNSRYVYARALTSAKATKTAEALSEILDENALDTEEGIAPIEKIRSDGGAEFEGAFAKLLEERGIESEITQAGTHARLARLDRYHGTLRRQIGQLFALTNSQVWVGSLQDLIKNHNTSPSRALNAAGKNLAPSNIGPEEEQELRAADLDRVYELRKRVNESKQRLEPGMMVRLLTSKLKRVPAFIKAQEATWTPETYPVIEREGPNSYRIEAPAGENVIWPEHSLQRVASSVQERPPAGPSIDRRVVSAQRREARNISVEEQAAALAAPSRPRRERPAPGVYRGMLKGRGRHRIIIDR